MFYCRSELVFKIVLQYRINSRNWYKYFILFRKKFGIGPWIGQQLTQSFTCTCTPLVYSVSFGLLRRSRLKIYAHSSSLTDVENVIEVLGNIKAAICGTCRHWGSFSILCKTSRDCGAEWVGSVKWKKGVALCHNMGQCMSLAISLQKCLESLREEKRDAGDARIDCEKEER